MEMDVLHANLFESRIDIGAEEDFQTLSEEEAEKALAQSDDVSTREEALVASDINKEEGKGVGEAPMKQGSRKRLFKSTSTTVGSTKMRIASALAKRAASKGASRHGDDGKPSENKVPSNPKATQPK